MSEFEESTPLEPLDPGSRDPGFWLRFHGRVMREARAELARRRVVGSLSVVDVVFAWRRALVPLALMAAALAGILIMGNGKEPVVEVVALEELLTEDLSLHLVPSGLPGQTPLETALMAVAEGGF